MSKYIILAYCIEQYISVSLIIEMKYVKLLNSSLKIQHQIHINQTFQMFLRVTIKCRDKSFADFNCLNASLS